MATLITSRTCERNQIPVHASHQDMCRSRSSPFATALRAKCHSLLHHLARQIGLWPSWNTAMVFSNNESREIEEV